MAGRARAPGHQPLRRTLLAPRRRPHHPGDHPPSHFLLGLAEERTTTVATGDLAAAVGLGRSTTTLARTLERLHWHRLAHYRDGRIDLPTYVPRVPRHEHHKLPPWLPTPGTQPQPATNVTAPSCGSTPPPGVTLAADLEVGQVIDLAGRPLSVRSTALTGGRVMTELQHVGGDHNGLIVELDWDPGEAVRLRRRPSQALTDPPGLDL